jgi:hypothetical protein
MEGGELVEGDGLSVDAFKRELGLFGTVREQRAKLFDKADEIPEKIKGLSKVSGALWRPFGNIKPHTVTMSEYQETVYNAVKAEEGAAREVCDMAYPQGIPLNTEAVPVEQLKKEKVFAQLGKYSPKIGEVVRTVKSLKGAQQAVFCVDRRSAELVAACLEANGMEMWDLKSQTGDFLLAPKDAAGLKNALEEFNREGSEVKVFVGAAEALPNVAYAHFLAPPRFIGALEEATSKLKAGVVAHIYLARQTRDGNTLEEDDYDLLLKKKQANEHWTKVIHESVKKCNGKVNTKSEHKE